MMRQSLGQCPLRALALGAHAGDVEIGCGGLVLQLGLDDRHEDHWTVADLTSNTFRDHLILEYESPKFDGDLRTPISTRRSTRRHASGRSRLCWTRSPRSGPGPGSTSRRSAPWHVCASWNAARRPGSPRGPTRARSFSHEPAAHGVPRSPADGQHRPSRLQWRDLSGRGDRSVLDPRFADFELIVCDNASTDRTGEIAEGFAAVDPRVRYARNPANVGAAPNYIRVFGLARGRYFKWLAHDDRLLPDYLTRTVEAMEARPELVLCNSRVELIDETGRQIGDYASVLDEADRLLPAERFARFVLEPHTGVDIFGLLRRTALAGSILHASFHGADRALLAQLALRGPMRQLPMLLLQIRKHGQRYTRQATSALHRAAWPDAARRSRRQVPILESYAAYSTNVGDEPLTPSGRWRCRLALARWWLVNWNALRVVVDVMALLLPGAVGFVERLKLRLAGAAPGNFVSVSEAPPDTGGDRTVRRIS